MNPPTTLAVILGASVWPKSGNTLPASTAFSSSALEFKSYLLSTSDLALPSANVLDLFDHEESPSELLEEVSTFLRERKAAAKASGLPEPSDLMVYYTGHGGFTGQDKAYFLAVRTTNASTPGASSIRMADLASVLKADALDLRRYLILDCCFSAAAYTEYQTAPAQAAKAQTLDSFPTRGTSLLCSSSRRSVSIANDGKGHTMFSGALLDVLRRGDEQAADDFFSLQQVGVRIRNFIRDQYPDEGVRPEVLSPDQREGDIADLPLFPNVAISQPALRSAVRQLTTRIQAVERQSVEFAKGLSDLKKSSGELTLSLQKSLNELGEKAGSDKEPRASSMGAVSDADADAEKERTLPLRIRVELKRWRQARLMGKSWVVLAAIICCVSFYWLYVGSAMHISYRLNPINWISFLVILYVAAANYVNRLRSRNAPSAADAPEPAFEPTEDVIRMRATHLVPVTRTITMASPYYEIGLGLFGVDCLAMLLTLAFNRF